MKRNTFFVEFRNKTDEELEYILNHKDKYVHDAIIAAREILSIRERRIIEISNYPSELASIDALEDQLDITKPPTHASENDFVTTDLLYPELYTKSTIVVFTTVFGAIIGSILMAINFTRTNDRVARIYVISFGLLFTILTILIFDYFNINIVFALLSNLIAGTILNGKFWNKYIGKEYLHRARNWTMACLISILVTVPFILFVIFKS